MSSNFNTIEPLNWKGLVAEAIKRRKQEKLTQKEHALIAGVSVPTMLDFERGSTTLTLQKIMDILSVVGLVSNDDATDNLERFYEAAESRWFEKVKLKPKECSSQEFWDIVFRHSFGSLTYTFEVLTEESLKIKPEKMIATMSSIHTLRYDWRGVPFYIYDNNPQLKPYIIENSIIEHHFRQEQIESNYNDTNDTSFWWASTSGLFHFHSGYVEDNLKNGPLQKGRYIYISEPIYRAIQMIDYASKVAQKLTQSSSAKIALKVTYSGLNGRQLRFEESSFETYKSKQNGYSSKIEFVAKTINETSDGHLANLVVELLGNLFLQFDFYKIDKEYIHFIIKQVYEKNPIKMASST